MLRIESEASVPSVDVVAKLAIVLHVSPGYLAYGIEPSPPSSVDESTMTLAERLRQVRELSGLSLNALAKVSGVARTTIGYIESGETSPSIATVELLARALGCLSAGWPMRKAWRRNPLRSLHLLLTHSANAQPESVSTTGRKLPAIRMCSPLEPYRGAVIAASPVPGSRIAGTP